MPWVPWTPPLCPMERVAFAEALLVFHVVVRGHGLQIDSERSSAHLVAYVPSETMSPYSLSFLSPKVAVQG